MLTENRYDIETNIQRFFHLPSLQSTRLFSDKAISHNHTSHPGKWKYAIYLEFVAADSVLNSAHCEISW